MPRVVILDNCYASFSVCFKVFDKDHDGQLNKQELMEMLESLHIVRNEYNSPETLVSSQE